MATVNTAVTRKSELEYLSAMLPQMRNMALSIDEPTLAYLIEMAMLEANLQLEIANGGDPVAGQKQLAGT